jgi:DASS family divalent anion:Na+ symporter
VLAPFTPSNTARGGGIVHPIMKSIANAFESDPARVRRARSGPIWHWSTTIQPDHLGHVSDRDGAQSSGRGPGGQGHGPVLHLSWTSWALYMLLPGLLCLLLMPLAVYLLSPPELKATPNAVEYARAEMARMGLSARNG